jgi:hypothetical protein
MVADAGFAIVMPSAYRYEARATARDRPYGSEEISGSLKFFHFSCQKFKVSLSGILFEILPVKKGGIYD